MKKSSSGVFKKICPCCGKEFTYKSNDIEVHVDFGISQVYCPHCGLRVNHNTPNNISTESL